MTFMAPGKFAKFWKKNYAKTRISIQSNSSILFQFQFKGQKCYDYVLLHCPVETEAQNSIQASEWNLML